MLSFGQRLKLLRKEADLSQTDLAEQLFVSVGFFLEYYDLAKREFDACYNCISYLAELADHFGHKEYGLELRERFNSMLDI